MNHESIAVSQNLRLVQLQPEQADVLFALTDNNREYLGKFLPWVSSVKTAEDSRRHIKETLEKRAAGSSYTYGIELSSIIVGDISLRNIRSEDAPPEIGYWISPGYAGRGITTLAVRALTDFGFRELALENIIIKADQRNVASNKVAQKAGYLIAGTETIDGRVLNIWRIEATSSAPFAVN